MNKKIIQKISYQKIPMSKWNFSFSQTHEHLKQTDIPKTNSIVYDITERPINQQTHLDI